MLKRSKWRHLAAMAYTTLLSATVALASEATSSENPTASAAVFKVINAGGPGCPPTTPEVRALFDKYRAWHYCFTYKFAAEADFFTDVTNIVYDVINVIIPPTKFIDLYQPTKNSIRFAVTEGQSYRLYKYWTRDIGNVPPPGKYTDHKFVNVTDRSIDYWWKLKQRGLGKNARISGVAEVVFLPDDMMEKAHADGFLQ